MLSISENNRLHFVDNFSHVGPLSVLQMSSIACTDFHKPGKVGQSCHGQFPSNLHSFPLLRQTFAEMFLEVVGDHFGPFDNIERHTSQVGDVRSKRRLGNSRYEFVEKNKLEQCLVPMGRQNLKINVPSSPRRQPL